jgi:hypothetical protein
MRYEILGSVGGQIGDKIGLICFSLFIGMKRQEIVHLNGMQIRTSKFCQYGEIILKVVGVGAKKK